MPTVSIGQNVPPPPHPWEVCIGLSREEVEFLRWNLWLARLSMAKKARKRKLREGEAKAYAFAGSLYETIKEIA
ncbi:hypothetical protein SAMN02745126_03986 [Enhydrobacter aerosaccus]|uniref:Uncharacterized protein n=1 Tax=Enhydrobacter aerosaccus TaxID=225324 RepID=A0A1T4RNN7_9HYPH|nr:hypothetical protein SAMN02745126_03986 [Enhydrobacter aerosaccus]